MLTALAGAAAVAAISAAPAWARADRAEYVRGGSMAQRSSSPVAAQRNAPRNPQVQALSQAV